MNHALLPRLVEPVALSAQLGAKKLLRVHVGYTDDYAEGHLPGAIFLDYERLLASQPPVMGLLPDAAQLTEVMSAIGLTPDTHVVAYDGKGNSRAARFLWTLDAIGHSRYSLLNGGVVAWQQERLPVSTDAATPVRSPYKVSTLLTDMVADKQWILDHLDDDGVCLVDARTDEEYAGRLARANASGHIPGAINYDYAKAIDQNNGLRLKSLEVIREELKDLGITPDKEIVVYCQTHHRSAHTYFVLKTLGYPRVRGYPGSWSEWGNDPGVPTEL